MKKHRFTVIPLLLLMLFLPVMAGAIEVGAEAPDFELPDLGGTKVHLSDYKGQYIILKLATTWCPTCKQQTQEFRAAKDFLKENHIQVVDVFVQDSESMVKKYVKGLAEDFPYMPLIDDSTALRAYNVYLIPRVLLIDPDFKVRRDGSLMPAKELKATLTEMIQSREKDKEKM